jgi:putative ABC transport system permease protein
VRTWDVVGLALMALWQRKLRSCLTTLGVAVGSFILVASGSIGMGVHRILMEQMRKQDQLRRILVWRGSGTPREEIPPAELEVKGAMSEARRLRLREAIVRRFQMTLRPTGSGVKPDHVEQLAELEHVTSVTPSLNWMGQARLESKSKTGLIYTASSEDLGIARRVITGEFFRKGQRDGVLVSESLVYGWGIVDEADVEKVLGRTVRLEVAQPGLTLPAMLMLLNARRPDLTKEEVKVVRKAIARVPEAIEKLDMPDQERQVLLKLLADVVTSEVRTIVQEQPIVGVFRDVERHEMSPWDSPPRPIDVLVPAAVAEQMHFARPGPRIFAQVVVRVDHEDNLRAVHDRIKAMGMEAFSLAEVVEQVRLNVLLIVIACTFVAAVALAVAGLGIINTMLMSVLERTHEIGVMKALGARDSHVLGLFLMEGALTGAAGALVGLVAAWLISFPGDRIAAWLVARQTPMQLDGSVFAFPPGLMLGVPVAVCVLTTLAAVYPARRAARIDPIAALRQQ